MNILITGIAGMIGFHLSKLLIQNNHNVSGIDNFNDYYDLNLKKTRADILLKKNITILENDLITMNDETWEKYLNNIDIIVHLAAYANTRHSLDNAQTYIDNNITGTNKLILAAEKNNINKILYASSSCVMHGQNLPWSEKDSPLHQNNPYGWSKRVNECQFMHSSIRQHFGMRFFTVYGPYGRPDMALFHFTKNIINGETIKLFNKGEMFRDFTYISDTVNGIQLLLNKIISTETELKEIFNIGSGTQINLTKFVREIELNLNRKAIIELAPPHPADTPNTWADINKMNELGYKPKITIEKGIAEFISWYKNFYQVN